MNTEHWIVIGVLVLIYIVIPFVGSYVQNKRFPILCITKSKISLVHKWSGWKCVGKSKWQYYGIGEVPVQKKKRVCRRCGKTSIEKFII